MNLRKEQCDGLYFVTFQSGCTFFIDFPGNRWKQTLMFMEHEKQTRHVGHIYTHTHTHTQIELQTDIHVGERRRGEGSLGQ